MESDRLLTTGTAAYLGWDGHTGLKMRTVFAQGTSQPVDAYAIVGWIEALR